MNYLILLYRSADDLVDDGVRWPFPELTTFSQSLEPQSITLNTELNTLAYVSLQVWVHFQFPALHYNLVLLLGFFLFLFVCFLKKFYTTQR